MTHPLLRELLAMLPPPEAPFPSDRQRQWVEAAEAVLALVYGAEVEDVEQDLAADVVEPVDAPAAYVEQAAESPNGSYNGATTQATNGHEIAGRHRRPTFGRL